ncbi:WXG100 family type VII secretion target [Nocardioides jiangxiensis]|uniref:ESAT-6-like protein n=1 Tax=Nocardioides jiangxiensis TaxID=3064524 RepID=A0ABT9B3X7_9ACTN|nr:WXG100 family type VII secretion target [Nocardioides sp. WY-20]MDO7868006.1 WXG100 family type VII secretion target [Nocardioides sp. WY-20]
MSGMLRVGHAALDDAATGLRSGASRIEGTLDDLTRRLRSRSPEWTGAASEAFERARLRWDTAMRDMQEVLHAMGVAVAAANDEYRHAEAANARRFGG